MQVTRAHAYEIRSVDLAEHFFGDNVGPTVRCLNDGARFALAERRCPVCGSEQFTLLARPERITHDVGAKSGGTFMWSPGSVEVHDARPAARVDAGQERA